MGNGDYTAHELTAIRKAADIVVDAAVQWAEASRLLAGAFIAKGAFGQVGDDNNIPTTYNGIVTGARETLDEGVTNLEEASYSLYRIAKAYKDNEESVKMDLWLAGGGTIESWHRHRPGLSQEKDA